MTVISIYCLFGGSLSWLIFLHVFCFALWTCVPFFLWFFIDIWRSFWSFHGNCSVIGGCPNHLLDRFILWERCNKLLIIAQDNLKLYIPFFRFLQRMFISFFQFFLQRMFNPSPTFSRLHLLTFCQYCFLWPFTSFRSCRQVRVILIVPKLRFALCCPNAQKPTYFWFQKRC